MKLVLVPVLSFFIAISVAFLLVGLRSASDRRSFPDSSLFSPLSVFLVFNVIVVAVLLASHMPGAYEGGLFVLPLDEEEGCCGDSGKYKPRSDGDGDGYGCGGADRDIDSDGNNEDGNDSGSKDNTGWEDEEEQEGDDNLEKRIEDFIDKVVKGWREEMMKEHSTQL